MFTTSNEISEITFKCRQHSKTAISFCKTKFCSERLLCASCFHPHTEIESIDSLFAFSTLLKRDALREDNNLFVNRFLVSLGDVFRSIKSTEENLLWLHQMLIAVSESSAQLKASVRSLHLLSVQLTNFLSQCRDIREVTDSRQLSELIEWYLALRTTVTSQMPFDEKDYEFMDTLNHEVNLVSQNLCEKVLFLAQRFNIMKRGGTARVETVTPPQIPASGVKGLTTLLTKKPSSLSDSVMEILKHEPKVEIRDYIDEKRITEKMELEKREKLQDSPPTQSNRDKRHQNREINQQKNSAPVKRDSMMYRLPKKPKIKETTYEVFHHDEKISTSEKSDESAEIRRPFEVNQKEKIEVVERWLKNLEVHPSEDQAIQEEAQKLRVELDAVKELIKTSRVVTEKNEDNPIKDLKRDIAQILQDLYKGTDNKPTEAYLEEAKKRIEEVRVEVVDEFNQKVTEETIRNLISKMKESRIDLKSEMSKLIEICLEYQLRWGKSQPEIAGVYSKQNDFYTYQNIMERYCRLRLAPANHEKVLNDFFLAKAAQIHLEYFYTCLQKNEMLSTLQMAYSNNTNELDSQMTFEKLRDISISKAREIVLLAANPTDINLTMGEGHRELSELIEQAEKLQAGIVAVLENYEQNQSREQVLQEAEKTLQTRLFFEELVQLKPFNPKITLKVPNQGKTKKSKTDKGYYYDSGDDSSDEFRDTRKNKKMHFEEVPQSSITTRNRVKP